MMRFWSSSTTPVLSAVMPKRGPDRLTVLVNGGGSMTFWADAAPADRAARHMRTTTA